MHNRRAAGLQRIHVTAQAAERHFRGLFCWRGLRWLALAAAIGGALVAQAGTTGPPASAAEGRGFSPMGMATHLMWADRSKTAVDAELNRMAAAGSRIVRFDVGWPSMEPNRGHLAAYHMQQLDYILAGALERGIEPQVCVLGTPAWANNSAGFYVPPTDYSDFGDFMSRFAARYRGRIKYYEIWNEPNHPYFWRASPSAATYTRFLKTAYTAVKSSDPGALVISGGLSHCDKDYLQDMYDAGARGYFDLLGLHPYTGNHSPYYAYSTNTSRWNYVGMRDMRAVLDANGDPAKRIWATEIGWQTSVGGDPTRPPWPVSETTQAKYVYEAYERLFAEFTYVEAMCIYDARNNGTSLTDPQQNFGLMRADYRPKPSYYSFVDASLAFWPQPLTAPSANAVNYGQAVSLSLRLPKSWGSTPVTVQRRVAGAAGWQAARSAVTGADGTARVSVVPTATTSFRTFSSQHESVGQPVVVRVRPLLGLRASKTLARRYARIGLSSWLTKVPNALVAAERKTTSGWVLMRNARTDSTGHYALLVSFSKPGRHYVRMRFAGDPRFLPVTSGTISIRVL